MVFSFLYLAVRALLGALVRSRRGLHVKDLDVGSLGDELGCECPRRGGVTLPYLGGENDDPQFWLTRRGLIASEHRPCHSTTVVGQRALARRKNSQRSREPGRAHGHSLMMTESRAGKPRERRLADVPTRVVNG